MKIQKFVLQNMGPYQIFINYEDGTSDLYGYLSKDLIQEKSSISIEDFSKWDFKSIKEYFDEEILGIFDFGDEDDEIYDEEIHWIDDEDYED